MVAHYSADVGCPMFISIFIFIFTSIFIFIFTSIFIFIFIYMADRDEDDLVAHYSADVGCPTGLQGVAAPYCADYVLLL